MSTTLYELTETFKQIQMMVEEDDGDEKLFEDTLDSIDWNDNFEEKCDSYVMVIRNVEMSIGADEGQIKTLEKILEGLKASKKSKENKIERMKTSLGDAMIACDKKKFETKRFKFRIQKNPPSLVIDKPEDIPLEFYKVPEPQVDNTAIKEALKNGKKLTFAHLEQKEGVRFQ